jgi:predicted nucleic-acid-binding protein
MVKIQGLQELKRKLAKLQRQADKDGEASVVVGFTQSYAVHVHENKESHHEVGQAKYLEQPAREKAKELGRIVQEAYSKGSTLEKSLLLAGYRLQREAQQLTPVDTGALRASAFIALEKDLIQVSSEAYSKGQEIRAKILEHRKEQSQKRAVKKKVASLKKDMKKVAKKAKDRAAKQKRKQSKSSKKRNRKKK